MASDAEAPPPSGMEVFSGDDDAERIVELLSHPTRSKIFRIAARRDVSAKEIADFMGEPVDRVSYHMRTLATAGLVEPVRRTRRRGAIETHYRAVATLDFSEEVLESLSPDVRGRFMSNFIGVVTGDINAAIREGASDEDDFLCTLAHFIVTPSGRRRLEEEVRTFYRRMAALEEELRAEAEAAPDGEQLEMNLFLTHYEGDRSRERNAPFLVVRNEPADEEELPVIGSGLVPPAADEADEADGA